MDESLVQAKKREPEKTEEPNEALRPGDPGWCYRARVPRQKSQNYVNRPEWQSQTDISRTEKKEKTRLEKHMIALAERKKHARGGRRAVAISIEGTKMPL